MRTRRWLRLSPIDCANLAAGSPGRPVGRAPMVTPGASIDTASSACVYVASPVLATSSTSRLSRSQCRSRLPRERREPVSLLAGIGPVQPFPDYGERGAALHLRGKGRWWPSSLANARPIIAVTFCRRSLIS
jgi:hypothetical protein